MENDFEELKSLFIRNHKWSKETLDLALETEFKCAYCGKYFFEDVDSYYQLNVEHIIPRKHGGTEEFWLYADRYGN